MSRTSRASCRAAAQGPTVLAVATRGVSAAKSAAPNIACHLPIWAVPHTPHQPPTPSSSVYVRNTDSARERQSKTKTRSRCSRHDAGSQKPHQGYIHPAPQPQPLSTRGGSLRALQTFWKGFLMQVRRHPSSACPIFETPEIRYRSDSDGHDQRIPYYYSECEYYYHFILRMRHRTDSGFEFEPARYVLPFNTLPRPCNTNMPMFSGRLSANGSVHTTY